MLPHNLGPNTKAPSSPSTEPKVQITQNPLPLENLFSSVRTPSHQHQCTLIESIQWAPHPPIPRTHRLVAPFGFLLAKGPFIIYEIYDSRGPVEV